MTDTTIGFADEEYTCTKCGRVFHGNSLKPLEISCPDCGAMCVSRATAQLARDMVNELYEHLGITEEEFNEMDTVDIQKIITKKCGKELTLWVRRYP